MALNFLKAFLKRAALGISRRPLAEERGMATAIVLILVGLMTTIALSMIGLNQEMSTRDLRYLHFLNSLDIIQSNIYAFGQNNYAFDATLAKNYAQSPRRMVCIKNQTTCSTPTFATAERVILTWPDGTVYYDYADTAKTAFTLKGEPCTTNYNTTKVTNGCLLRIDLKWSPFCNNVPCVVSRNGPDRLIFMTAYFVPTYDAGGIAITKSFLPLYVNNYEGSNNVREGPLNSMSEYR